MFSYLQSRIRGTATTGPGAPPPGLLAFYWHFVKQTKGWYALMFVTSLAVALIDTVIGRPRGRDRHVAVGLRRVTALTAVAVPLLLALTAAALWLPDSAIVEGLVRGLG